MSNLKEFWNNRQFHILLLLYVSIAIVASMQGILHGPKPLGPQGIAYTDYNNYVIFKYSFFHLKDGKNLYQAYPAEHWDLYKYSPAFSMFFSVFAYLPDSIGLTLWNLLNSVLFFLAIVKLSEFNEEKKSRILLFCFIELLGSLQNAQSNGLMAALIIFTFIFLESEDYFLACFCIAASVYIKIFGAVGFALFLMYPEKKKMFLYTTFWFLVMGSTPILFTGFDQLVRLYRDWGILMAEDHEGGQGLSLAGILASWTKLEIPKNLITLLGIIVFCLPLARSRLYRLSLFRHLMLASVLLWTIVFNHKAESPTFIISMAGIAIWYFCRPRGTTDQVLMVLAFILTTISVTDLVPGSIREGFIRPYGIKGIMSVVIWGKLIYELLTMNYWKAMDYEMKSDVRGMG